MAEQNHLDRVWDIIELVGVCMLTTRFAGGLRARPLEARPDSDAGIIWFVTDLRSAKEQEIESEHDVGLVFVDAKANAYLSITARAEVGATMPRRPKSGRPPTTCGGKDRTIQTCACCASRPLTAELWDGPASKAVAAFEFVKAQLTGEKPNLGENRKTTVDMP